MSREIVSSVEGEYRRYKMLGEGALEQMPEGDFARQLEGGNSVATIVWHISGNLESRFMDFLTSDGEKEWRDREAEFARRSVSREALLQKWNRGWSVLLAALEALDDSQLSSKVTIRGVALSVIEALHRSLAHASYHVGQIVFLGRVLRGDAWKYLTIPPGGSAAYNANPVHEKPKR
jgi:hypothetical protein